MTLEQIIRYAITGMIIQGDETPHEINDDIQELVDILIDFSSITGESLVDLLNK